MPQGGYGPARGRRVLLVDDNAEMRALIRGLVEEVPAIVHEYGDAEGALAAYAALRPDWVLMDLELGGMDGIAATRALRALDAHARVIIVTAHGEDEYRRAAAAAGACGFVLKEDLLVLAAMVAGPLPPAGPEER